MKGCAPSGVESTRHRGGWTSQEGETWSKRERTGTLDRSTCAIFFDKLQSLSAMQHKRPPSPVGPDIKRTTLGAVGLKLSASPLLLVLAMQPELVLLHLTGQPSALLRFAQTCRLAHRAVSSSAVLWREVCVRHHVYQQPSPVNAGPWFVTSTDASQLSGSYVFIFATLTHAPASEAMALYRSDMLFGRGKCTNVTLGSRAWNSKCVSNSYGFCATNGSI